MKMSPPYQWTCMLLFLIGLMHVVLSADASAQQRVLAGDEYSELLNLVFSPAIYLNPKSQAAVIVLRYAPSTATESELIFVNESSHTRVVEIRPRGGSVFNQANQLISVQPNAALNAHKLAEQISVVASERELKAGRFEQLYADALKSISDSLAVVREEYRIRQKTNELTIPVDGTTYTLMLMQGLQKIELSFYDTELGKSKQRTPLTVWMASVRAGVDNGHF